MYAVVGCKHCDALWVIETGAETAQCPRCRSRHRTERLRELFSAEDPERARQARSTLLADRSKTGETSEELADFATLGDEVESTESASVTDVEAMGLDADAINTAGQLDRPSRPNRRELVLEAIESLDPATHEGVLSYASDRGCPESTAERILDGLCRDGEVTRSATTYRRL